jgi:hypothetical protein
MGGGIDKLHTYILNLQMLNLHLLQNKRIICFKTREVMKNLFYLLPLSLFLNVLCPSFKLSAQSSLITNAGTYHNEGLGMLLNYYSDNPQTPRTISNSYDLLSQYFNQQYGWEIVQLSTELEALLTQVVQNQNTNESVQLARSMLDSIQRKLIPMEYQLTQNLLNIFQQGPSQQFESQLNNLKAQYDSYTWDLDNGEGHLIGGSLNIALASLDFWKVKGVGGNNDISAIWNIIAIDGWTYLTTWAAQYLDECVENDPCPGSICTCPGQWKRVRQGILFAAGASSIASL